MTCNALTFSMLNGFRQKRAKTPKSAAADNVATVGDDTFMTSLYQQFSDMSGRLEDETGDAGDDDVDDDIMPQAAANMGSGHLFFLNLVYIFFNKQICYFSSFRCN